MATRDENFLHSRMAIDYTLQKLWKGSSNRGCVTKNNGWSVSDEELLDERNDPSNNVTVMNTGGAAVSKIRAEAAKAMKMAMGNCAEHSAIAFMYLYNKSYFPIDRIRFSDKNDHIFVVIGRNYNTNPRDPITWNDECVVCDAWLKKSIFSKEYMTFGYKPSSKHELYLRADSVDDVTTFNGESYVKSDTGRITKKKSA